MRLIRPAILAATFAFALFASWTLGAAQAAPVAASSLASQLAPPALKDVTPVYYYYHRYYRRHYYRRHYYHRHYYHHYYYHHYYYHRPYYRRHYYYRRPYYRHFYFY